MNTQEREVMKLALEALEYEPINKTSGEKDLKDQAITAIKEALAQPEQEYKHGYADAMNWKAQNHLEHWPAAQPEQEPVACVGPWHDGRLTLVPRYSHQIFEREQPLYTTPPQRTWVGLTWNDIPEEWVGNVAFMEGAKWSDKQLKEKNNG